MHFLYIITNLVNGKKYVGQTRWPEKRWNYHKWKSKRERQKLAFAMRKYGISNFTFQVIQEGIPSDQINELEVAMIARLDTYKNGYNSTIGGEGSCGCAATPERKRKISESKIGKPRDSATIEKMKMSQIGKKHTAESSNKKRQKMLGRFVSEETRRKISAIHKGKTLSLEQREHLRRINLGKRPSPESIAKSVLANTGKKRSAETKRLLSEKAKIREAKRRMKNLEPQLTLF